jgi:hypothetical protein
MPERLTDAQIDLLRRFVAAAGDNTKQDWDALEVVRLQYGSLMRALLAELDATRAERDALEGRYMEGRRDALMAVCQFLRAYADTFTESPMARVSLRKAAMLLEKKPDAALAGESASMPPAKRTGL